MLPSLYGPKIFRASPEKDFFDSIGQKHALSGPLNRVWNAPLSRPSMPSVGNAVVIRR
jgi:hypothetical protein